MGVRFAGSSASGFLGPRYLAIARRTSCSAYSSGRGVLRRSTPDPRQAPDEQVADGTVDTDFIDDTWDKDIEGNANGLLSQNTQLGKAVDDACSEMHHLRGLEDDVLQQAQGLLEQMGYKKSIFEGSAAQATDDDTGSAT